MTDYCRMVSPEWWDGMLIERLESRKGVRYRVHNLRTKGSMWPREKLFLDLEDGRAWLKLISKEHAEDDERDRVRPKPGRRQAR